MPKLTIYIFLAACVISIGLGFIAVPHHPHFVWERIPGFDAVFGFVGCLIIIIASKWIGHTWLQKNEDYYD